MSDKMCYVLRKPCGCILIVIGDDHQLDTKKLAKIVGACVEAGLVVERRDAAYIRAYFEGGCRCSEKNQPRLPMLDTKEDEDEDENDEEEEETPQAQEPSSEAAPSLHEQVAEALSEAEAVAGRILESVGEQVNAGALDTKETTATARVNYATGEIVSGNGDGHA